MKNYYIYIITNKDNSVFYIGVTNNLEKRIYQHKEKTFSGFSKKYNLHKLLYFEETSDIEEAIKKEKQLKRWKRDWKINLIRKKNPLFLDLADEWFL